MRTRLAVLALATILVGIPLAAKADTYYDNRVGNPHYDYGCISSDQAHLSYVCRTDNASLSWVMARSLDTTTSAHDTPAETAINETMDKSYSGTDLNPKFDTSPSFSGSAETDIYYYSKPGDFTTGDTGYTFCQDAGSSFYECDQQYVNFATSNIARQLACHETGHAVGLLHGTNANPYTTQDNVAMECMMKNTVYEHRGLGSINTRSINSMY